MNRNRYDTQLKSMAKLASYFDTFGLHEPIGKYNTPVAFASGDASLTIWEHVNSNPEEKKNFMLAMVAMANKHITIGNYDFSWAVAKAAENPDRPLVVDVGGGQGHALQEIVDANPGLAMERCVLEDLAPVLEQAKANAKGSIQRARFVALDFHSEQPVKGALVYYIRRCLHDYGDDDCVDILKQISDAMAADSRVLIVENVLGVPAAPSAVGNDIFMMMLGGKERTLEGFESIMMRAGLVVEKLWRFKGTEYAVVEGRKV
ncbi:O-methyltransferase [Pochonia chlamydosporia 170]|uniref:O-methyltransferase n=1 Tax=Pochonia chlamydosporia 170 TaxID=1380566 RepID=A0A179FQT4_METCM|nr:O-methyltransferase [Pochonia chlamydosporia 170]OAQ67954.2 O-methyltransferase [Pochonia chlamydosporia 170]